MGLKLHIDECDEKSHECRENTDCKNTKGSYRCKCKTGFHGDGYNCKGIPVFIWVLSCCKQFRKDLTS